MQESIPGIIRVEQKNSKWSATASFCLFYSFRVTQYNVIPQIQSNLCFIDHSHQLFTPQAAIWKWTKRDGKIPFILTWEILANYQGLLLDFSLTTKWNVLVNMLLFQLMFHWRMSSNYYNLTQNIDSQEGMWLIIYWQGAGEAGEWAGKIN